MEVIVLKKTAIASVTAILGALVLMWIMQATAQKAPVPKPQDKLALGENDVKQLMLLIDTDKNGKITKQAWMEFMEAEFDRLDKNKSGELDAQELALSRLRVSPFAKVGK
jgi:EF hand domain-containing protein